MGEGRRRGSATTQHATCAGDRSSDDCEWRNEGHRRGEATEQLTAEGVGFDQLVEKDLLVTCIKAVPI